MVARTLDGIVKHRGRAGGGSGEPARPRNREIAAENTCASAPAHLCTARGIGRRAGAMRLRPEGEKSEVSESRHDFSGSEKSRNHCGKHLREGTRTLMHGPGNRKARGCKAVAIRR